MRAIVSTFLCGLLIASAQTQQQNAPAPATAKGVARFESSSQLVVVDVTAKDKSGAPIKGLKASDFTISEDGKKQDIKVFDYQELEQTAMPEPKLQPRPAVAVVKAPDVPAVRSVTANQIAPSRPGEVKYKDRRLLVMFFDMTSMPIQDQIRAQTAAQKFLKSQMTQSDLMAIMANSTDLKVLQDFTDDRDALAKAIKGLTIGEGSDLAVDGSTGADNEEDTGAAYTADDTEFNIFNTDKKLAALETAAKM
ncbi:MAG TPA: VWA domain-containing protein, partial [Candidatus Solibacter sp.]|nr:VWA domain-containing protein [Candidatus Solibacter sp.]